MLTALLVASAVPAHAWYGYKSPHVFRAPQVVVPVVPFWVPYTYTDPPVVATPPPYWYSCDNPQGYYGHVPQCPAGWRAVVPTSPR